jgi:hypothetical protein
MSALFHKCFSVCAHSNVPKFLCWGFATLALLLPILVPFLSDYGSWFAGVAISLYLVGVETSPYGKKRIIVVEVAVIAAFVILALVSGEASGLISNAFAISSLICCYSQSHFFLRYWERG